MFVEKYRYLGLELSQNGATMTELKPYVAVVKKPSNLHHGGQGGERGYTELSTQMVLPRRNHANLAGHLGDNLN